MIAKGNLHGDGGGLARYLLAGEKDEIAQLVETRGLESFGSDPVQAFVLLQKVAEEKTKSPLPFFHVQTRNPDGDKQLTDAQWLQIADREEKRLGLAGQPRIVSFHIQPNGEKHLHVGWFRIDLETMRAIDSGMYKNHLKQLSRQLEKEYGLQEVSSERKPDDRARAAERKEVEEARRLDMPVRAIRNAILDCLERTDGGKAFKAALEERGLMLANGDKRDCFVVVDQAGGHHPLNNRLTGYTLAATRARFADLDRAQLPSVDQAKELQGEKYPTPALARAAWEGRMREERTAINDNARDAPPEPTRPRDPEREMKPEERHPAYAHSPASSGKERAPPRDERPEAKHPAYAHEPEKARAEESVPAQAGDLNAIRADNAAYQEHRQQRRDDRAGARDTRKTFREEERQYDRVADVLKRTPGEAAKSVKDAGLKVANAAGVTTSLSSFVEGLLFGFMGGTGQPSAEEDYARAHASLEHMAESMERGECMSTADIANLTHTHLMNISRHGDDYVRGMIDDIIRDRERDSGREMER